MKKSHRIYLFGAAFALSACSGSDFTHVKPGQSARAHLATQNAPAAVPVPKPGALPAHGSNASALPAPDTGILAAPALPDTGGATFKAGDAFTRGSFAMESGQTNEAILAFEEAVGHDPAFTDAWSKLSQLYQSTGEEKKSIEAYKKAKKLGQPNGSAAPLAPGPAQLLPPG